MPRQSPIWTVAAASLAVTALAAIALAGTPQAHPSGLAVPAWSAPLPPGEPMPAAEQAQLDPELDLYNFPPLASGWSVVRLQSPPLQRFEIYRLRSPEGVPAQECTAILARDGEGVWLIPLRQAGHAIAEVDTDPYSYNAFNRTVALERPLPETRAAWAERALLYLALTGDPGDLVTDANGSDALGGRMATRYLPYVFPEANHRTGVQLYFAQPTERPGAGAVVEYGIEFDVNGLLRNVIPVHGSRSDVPPPLAGGGA